MAETVREKLKDIGNFGLTCSVEYAIVEQNLGDGFDYSILNGADTGLLSWGIKYDALPNNRMDNLWPDGPGDDVPVTTPAARGLWNFFCRMKAQGNASFEVVNPIDGKSYLAKFVEHRITFQMFAYQFYSVSGVPIQMRREAGVSLLPDGSLGILEPDPNDLFDGEATTGEV